MIRRFVNLVEQNFPARSYSLHRLDVAKHLFYPSTADAEAANAKEEEIKKKNNGSGSGGKPKPPLPSSEGRILYAAKEGGHCLLHDADEGVICSLPSLDFPMGDIGRPHITFSVPGAGGPGKEHESLYVMRSDDDDGRSTGFVVLDFNEPRRKWQRLPPPPCADEPGGSSGTIKSFTVLDGGRTICVYDRDTTYATYCFDTASREWRHAGDWSLPFDGRAEHVPELNTWLGFCPEQPRHLCAADLSAIGGISQAPPLQQVWEDFNPPPKKEWSKVLNPRYPDYVLGRTKWWTAEAAELVNLGSGRFCTAKFFQIQGEQSIGFHVNDTLDEEFFLVLTGVEVVRGGGGEEEGGLRMVRHKSKRYSFTNDCSIDWVL
ncbi:unnamed protein product [Urochloa decumbens]|uniref:Uncharacterized protein n=1 Tax=Urochloa decumbens TaxID=240449 RepID=A0ABC9GAY8_9POAL